MVTNNHLKSQLELDMPGRTTREWEGPTVAPRVQAALDAALQEEDDDADLELGGTGESSSGMDSMITLLFET